MWYGSLMTYLEKTDTFIGSLGMASYRVGGSVRDELLGRRVKDADYIVRGVDLATLGKALRVIGYEWSPDAKVSPLVLRDGRQAGWRVAARGLGCIEVVLPRTEISTGPGHRDFEIVIDPDLDLIDDAKRRDFTFNALYKAISAEPYYEHMVYGTILDPTERGIHDLERRRINITHADSFRDDPLRILRALRFISTLGYELGAETRATMALHADAVTGLTQAGVSGTVLDELCKLLMGQDPAAALRVARDTGVMAVAFPELAPMLGFDQGSRYHDMTTDEHTFTALETAAHVDAPLRVRMALLFHDSGKPETAWWGMDGRRHYYGGTHIAYRPDPERQRVIAVGSETTEDHEIAGARIWRRAANRLNAGKTLRDDVDKLIRNHMVDCQKVKPVRVRRERVRLGDDLLRDLYLMRMCDLSGKGSKNMKFLANVAAMEHVRGEAQDAGVPCGPRDLKINGHDVIELGATGNDIGRVLSAVLDEVVCDPTVDKQTREWQLKRAEAVL